MLLKSKLPSVMSFAIIYGAFFLRAFSFILLLPFFTRKITPDVWGAVLASQGLLGWLTLIIEFGFGLSLARKVAVNRDDLKRVREDVGNVYSAKLVLILPATLICYIANHFGILKNFPLLAWWALVCAVLQGFSPLWYYQAVEKMQYFSLIDIIGRLIYITLSIKFVTSSENAYLVLALQALSLLITNTITLSVLFRETMGFRLSFNGAFSALKEGLVISGFSILTSVYTSASTFLFALFAPAVTVALYGNADRLVRAGLSLLNPLNQILLPRSARAFAKGQVTGLQFARKLLLIYALLSVLGYMVGWLIAPIVVEKLFGHAYYGSIFYIRILLCLLPFTAINTVFVYHIFIPQGQESMITKLYSIISIITLLLICILVPMYGGKGMAVSMLFPEITAFSVLSYLIFTFIKQRRKELNSI